MKNETKRDDLYLLRWNGGKELECIKVKVTRRVTVFLADTDNEFDLITAVDSKFQRYSNVKPGLYIRKDDVTYTYRIDHWEYENEVKFFTKDELKIALNEMEHSADDLMTGVFRIKYYIEKIRAEEVL